MSLKKLLRGVPKSAAEKAALKNDRLLLLLGAFITGAGFSPSPLPFLLFIGMVPYFMVIERRKGLAEINRATFTYVFLLGLFTIYWVGGFTQAKDPFLMTGGIILFFINPIAFLIPSTLYYLWREHIHQKSALWLMPFFWLCYEYLYTLTDWSFPWLQLHNGISAFIPYIQIAGIIGGWGLTVLIAYCNVFAFHAYKNRKKRNRKFWFAAAGLTLFVGGPLMYGYTKLAAAEATDRQIKIGIVQPDLDPYDKWAEMQYRNIFALQLEKTRGLLEEKPDLVLWPETAVPVYFMGPAFKPMQDTVFNLITQNSVNLISGMPDIIYFENGDKIPPDAKYSESGKFHYATYNAILGFMPGSKVVQRYGKMKLVPFGEHVPFVDQFPIFGEWIKWGVGMTGWNVGQDTTIFKIIIPQKNAGVAGKAADTTAKVGAVVCYESIYSDLVTQMAVKGAQVFVVVTNDSWYGNTSGPYQHRDFARLRAVETGREVVRCANGGISCIIDPCGRIVSQTKMYEPALLSGNVSLHDGSTFYMEHPHLLVSIALLLSLAAFVGGIGMAVKNKLS